MGGSLFTAALGLAVAAYYPEPIQFNRDIRPILSDKCYACHGPDAANRKTALRFDIESSARIKLRNGHESIVPGDPSGSEVFQRVMAADTALRMPPAYLGGDKLS